MSGIGHCLSTFGVYGRRRLFLSLISVGVDLNGDLKRWSRVATMHNTPDLALARRFHLCRAFATA